MSGCTPHQPAEGVVPETGSASSELPLDSFGDILPDLAPGFAERDVLRHATSATLFRVHEAHGDQERKDASTALLHGDYVVEASGAASDAREAAATFLSDLPTSPSPMALCFIPSYAMRISDGSRTLDYVICFHCKQAIVFEGETHLSTDPVTGTGADIEALFVANHIPTVPLRIPGPTRF